MRVILNLSYRCEWLSVLASWSCWTSRRTQTRASIRLPKQPLFKLSIHIGTLLLNLVLIEALLVLNLACLYIVCISYSENVKNQLHLSYQARVYPPLNVGVGLSASYPLTLLVESEPNLHKNFTTQ